MSGLVPWCVIINFIFDEPVEVINNDNHFNVWNVNAKENQ